MSEAKRLLSYVRRAVDDYQMIADGDVIAVGISGGKDSLALLGALSGLARFYPHSFTVKAITIDMGLPGADYGAIGAYCEKLGVEYHIVPTQISQIIFDVRKEPNPCSLCAKMRRGALHRAAKEFGCNKVALGHHFDDVVETFLLNLFFEGRIGAFQPVTYLSRMDVTVIRPLIYMPEKNIRYYAEKEQLPVVTFKCPADGNTEREEMKQLLNRLDRQHKGLRHRIFCALQKANVDGFKEITGSGKQRAAEETSDE